MTNTKFKGVLFPAIALLVLSTAAACETDSEHGATVSDQEAEARAQAGLHPTAQLDDHAETPEELRDDLNIKAEEDKPKSAQEMREEMDLHPAAGDAGIN